MTKLRAAKGTPAPMEFPYSDGEREQMLASEWLLTNRIGAYASSSLLGCNTRRYHGLLVASTSPPMARMSALSAVMERIEFGGQSCDLAVQEFPDAFAPSSSGHLAQFVNDVAPTWVYNVGGAELVKELLLAQSANALGVRYTLHGPAARLHLRPFTGLRDFHSLRKADQPNQFTFEQDSGRLVVRDLLAPAHALLLQCQAGRFQAEPQWWYRFLYRQDIARGQEGNEDLYTPGCFVCDLRDGQSVLLVASLDELAAMDFDSALASRRRRLEGLAASVGAGADQTTRRLAVATDAFLAERSGPASAPQTTILAGYHWFADWGRDAFVALPGLLLATGRFAEAREVFRTFGEHIKHGLVPNRFDDYTHAAHYNSIDASLWFIVAAERYLAATEDEKFWRDFLMPAADTILKAYHAGTRFDIHADADGLLMGGSPATQLTWMDAKLGNEVVTPRHGKAVEVNALWYCAHRIMAQRAAAADPALAGRYAHQADLIAPAFVGAFWNRPQGCLYDCISDSHADATIRPNQIFAVSLPHSPLTPQQQALVVRTVGWHLLTPLGLRTLSPADSRYRRRYGGSWESRDRAYHQGTVWAWLIGPYVEAVLKTEPDKAQAVEQARRCLQGFEAHLWQAGVGSVSEIFDGDAPHHPNGCIAQAWSVAEVLRAKLLVDQAARALKKSTR